MIPRETNRGNVMNSSYLQFYIRVFSAVKCRYVECRLYRHVRGSSGYCAATGHIFKYDNGAF